MTAGVTFSAWREDEPIRLGEVLAVLGSCPADMMWTVRSLDCAPSPACKALQQEEGRQVEDDRLRELLRDEPQLLEGEITGLAGSPRQAWIRIRAVRGDEWDVETQDRELLDRLRMGFPDAIDLPG
jgi:hypothetical protein